jgi:hypothetical protein
MPKPLAAVSLGAIALVLLSFGTSFVPVGTDATMRDTTYDNSTVNRSSKADRLPIGPALVFVKTTAIRSPTFHVTRSTPDAGVLLTDCEPVISPLADTLSGWSVRECST